MKYDNLKHLKNYGIDLVSYVVERDFKNALQYYDKDDLVGYGVIGLLYAARKYDNSKGASFLTFSCKKIRQEIISFVRQKCQKRFRDIEGIDVETHSRASVQDEYDEEDERIYVRQAVNDLPEPHRTFAERYFFDKLTVKEFQQATTMKRHRIFQLRTQTIALLRVKISGRLG